MNKSMLKLGMTAGTGLVAGGTALVATPGMLLPGIIMIVVGAALGGGAAIAHPPMKSAGKGQKSDAEDPKAP